MRAKKPDQNDALPKERLPLWKRHTDEYGADELARLKFPNRKHSDAAIELVWGGALAGLPFSLDPNDINSLVVPKESVAYFKTAGLKFVEKAY